MDTLGPLHVGTYLSDCALLLVSTKSTSTDTLLLRVVIADSSFAIITGPTRKAVQSLSFLYVSASDDQGQCVSDLPDRLGVVASQVGTTNAVLAFSC